ncbi:hypothetical protein M0R45_002648 [Rubus argutus]|uniref:Uncharacterized protein n=1 Tax=Rubus argutus TaxID=59490 RepID=A0AAW1VR09_RUBAR
MGKIPSKKSKRLEKEQRSLLLHPKEEDEYKGKAYKANCWEWWKYDELPAKKRKMQQEEEMLGDYDQDDDEDNDVNNDPVLVIEEPQEKRQHLADNVPTPSYIGVRS